MECGRCCVNMLPAAVDIDLQPVMGFFITLGSGNPDQLGGPALEGQNILQCLGMYVAVAMLLGKAKPSGIITAPVGAVTDGLLHIIADFNGIIGQAGGNGCHQCGSIFFIGIDDHLTLRSGHITGFILSGIGDVISARVTHLEPFGAFVDIGCGIISFLPIDTISVSRIAHPKERFCIGMDIKVVVKNLDGTRVNLTHKELLGTWEENASFFAIGETVSGIIRSVEDYGVFVELAPNLAGLAEPYENALEGEQASVYIKNIVPEKMKFKLVIIDTFKRADYHPSLKYFYEDTHMDEFIYSPQNSLKSVTSTF